MKSLELDSNFKLSSMDVKQVKKFYDYGNGRLSKYGIIKPEALEYFSYNGSRTELGMSEYVNLRSIYIFDSALKDLGLKGLKKLEDISVKYAEVTDIPLEDCPSVKSIKLYSCSEIAAENLKRLAEMETLEELVLEGCNVTELDLSGSRELEQLALEFCGIREMDLSHNTKLKKLTLCEVPIISLDVTDCHELQRLTVKKCASLEKVELSRAEDIYLDNNEKLSVLSAEQAGSLHDVENKNLAEYKLKHPEQLYDLLCRGERASMDVSGYAALRSLDICGTNITRIDLSGTCISKKAVKEGKASFSCEKGVDVIYAEG